MPTFYCITIIDYVRAKGYSYAILSDYKNAVSGTGWDNYAGTGNGTRLAASEDYHNESYKHLYYGGPVISAKATFKVKNGAWNDETTADKPVTLTGRQGDTLKLKEGDIPPVQCFGHLWFIGGRQKNHCA